MGMEDREDVRGNQLRVRMPQNTVPVGDINLFEKEADCCCLYCLVVCCFLLFILELL